MPESKLRNLYILGAGFSNPAGLPLGSELLKKIIEKVQNPNSGISLENKTIFENSLSEYRSYTKQDINEINIENFIEYLDYQHFLKFNGGLNDDTPSGSYAQSIIRVLISDILLEQQKNIEKQNLYELFVDNLSDNDIVISLNYDTLLEYFFELNKLDYRLFPTYLGKYRFGFPKKALTLLKVHGSINWFDYKEYFDQITPNKLLENTPFLGLQYKADFIFNNHYDGVKLNPIIPLSFEANEKTDLKSIYWINDEDLVRYIDAYNRSSEIETNLTPSRTHPLILSPSYMKLLYSKPIKDLYYGASFYGSDADKIIIIGCSLTKYDNYIRQWLFDIASQYYGRPGNKRKISIINYAADRKQKRVIRNNYAFLGGERIDINFNGFNEKSFLSALKT